MMRPKAWSITLSSSSAMPMPQTMPPITWLRAVFGLMTRPGATAVTTRCHVDRAEVLVDVHLCEDCRVAVEPVLRAAWATAESTLARRLRRIRVIVASPGARSRTFSQTAFTAEPTDDAVNDPPSSGARGSDESPSVNVTCSIGRPSTSAAICVMIV